MTTPTEEALALLRTSGISTDVIASFETSIEDAPRDNQGQLDQKALYAKYKGNKLEVTSRRIKNITINWLDVLYKIGTRTGGLEMAPTHDSHPDLTRLLEVLNALHVLSEARNVTLGDKSTEIVKELWINKKGTQAVPLRELEASLRGRISEDEFPDLLGSLWALGIIRQEDGKVIKRETFTLVG
jgi:hypothetical protein